MRGCKKQRSSFFQPERVMNPFPYSGDASASTASQGIDRAEAYLPRSESISAVTASIWAMPSTVRNSPTER